MCYNQRQQASKIMELQRTINVRDITKNASRRSVRPLLSLRHEQRKKWTVTRGLAEGSGDVGVLGNHQQHEAPPSKMPGAAPGPG